MIYESKIGFSDKDDIKQISKIYVNEKTGKCNYDFYAAERYFPIAIVFASIFAVLSLLYIASSLSQKRKFSKSGDFIENQYTKKGI